MNITSPLKAALALALISAMAARAGAQTRLEDTPIPMWVPNSAVFDAVKVGNTLVIGGTFDYVGPPTGAFAIADAGDAANLNTRANLRIAVNDVVADGTGGWYVARQSDSGPRTPEVVHVLADGCLDPQFAAPPFSVASALALAGGHLFVGGRSPLMRTPDRALLALDPVTGALQPWTPAVMPPNVTSLFTGGGVLYTASFGQSFDSSGLALDVASGASLPFPALQTGEARAASGGRVYVITKTETTHTISAHAVDGTPVPTWTSPIYFAVTAMVASSSLVYATVQIGTDSGPSRVVALDAATGATVWTSPAFAILQAGLTDLALDGGTLYVGGGFGAVGTESRTRVAAFDATTGALQPWAPSVGGTVTTVAAANGRVAFGGGFSSVGGMPKRSLAALDLTTGRPAAVQPPDSSGAVFVLAASGDLVVAGTWVYPPPTQPEVFAYSASTGIRYPKALAVNGEMKSLAISGSTLFIAGYFTVVDGQPRRNLAAYDLAAGQILPWNPSPDDGVHALKVHAGALFAVGRFRSLTGYGRSGAASFALPSLEVTSWNPAHGGQMLYDVDAWQDRVFLGVHMRDDFVPPPGPSRHVVRTLAVDAFSDAPLNVDQPLGPELAVVGGIVAMSGDGVLVNVTEQPLNTVDGTGGQRLPWNPQIYSFEYAGSNLPPIVKLIGLDGYLVVTRSSTITEPPASELLVYRPRVVLPGAPRQIQMTVTGSTVSLAWSPGASPAPLGYIIEAGSAPGLSDIGRFPVGLATQVAANVAPGSYALRVRAIGAAGDGPSSSEWLFTTPATSTAPAAPTGLTGSVAGNVVTLGWTAAPGNATTYVVEGGSGPGLSNLGVLATGSLDTAIGGAVPPGTYYFRMRAANPAGTIAPSNEIVLVVP